MPPSPDPGPPGPAGAGDPAPYLAGVHLARTAENAAGIAALHALLGGPCGLAGLLDDLGHRARETRLPGLLGRAVEHGLAWDLHDLRDPRWWPQGITTSADADPSELVLGRPLVAVTWYAKDLGDGSGGHGSRVTVLDLATLRYEHVLLVEPRVDDTGRPAFEPLHVHAGGVAWAGDHLHVAATGRGLVTLRLDDVVRVDDPRSVGLDTRGHRFVLPVRLRHQGHADRGHRRLRHSFVSLDRGSDPPGLLVGEYGRRSDQTTRLARYDLDPATWLPATDAQGVSRPLGVCESGPARMQGAVVADGRHVLTSSHGPWLPGSVHVGRPGAFVEHRGALPMGPEDLAWWPSTDLLWTVTEHPWRRWVVAVRGSRLW